MGTQVHRSIWGCYFLPNCHGRTWEDAACDHVSITMGSNCQHSSTKGTRNSSSGSAGLGGRAAQIQMKRTHCVTLRSDRSLSHKFGQLQG